MSHKNTFQCGCCDKVFPIYTKNCTEVCKICSVQVCYECSKLFYRGPGFGTCTACLFREDPELTIIEPCCFKRAWASRQKQLTDYESLGTYEELVDMICRLHIHEHCSELALPDSLEQ